MRKFNFFCASLVAGETPQVAARHRQLPWRRRLFGLKGGHSRIAPARNLAHALFFSLWVMLVLGYALSGLGLYLANIYAPEDLGSNAMPTSGGGLLLFGLHVGTLLFFSLGLLFLLIGSFFRSANKAQLRLLVLLALPPWILSAATVGLVGIPDDSEGSPPAFFAVPFFFTVMALFSLGFSAIPVRYRKSRFPPGSDVDPRSPPAAVRTFALLFSGLGMAWWAVWIGILMVDWGPPSQDWATWRMHAASSLPLILAASLLASFFHAPASKIVHETLAGLMMILQAGTLALQLIGFPSNPISLLLVLLALPLHFAWFMLWYDLLIDHKAGPRPLNWLRKVASGRRKPGPSGESRGPRKTPRHPWCDRLR